MPLYKGRHVLNLQVQVDTTVTPTVTTARWAPTPLDIEDDALLNTSACAQIVRNVNNFAAWTTFSIVPTPSHLVVTYVCLSVCFN